MEAKELNIIIPAAGIGRRMKSYGPKALIRLGETNVLGRQINILKQLYPQSIITVVAGFEEWKIKEYLSSFKNDVKIVTNKHYTENNVAYSIGLAADNSCKKGDYLIVYGDLVFNPETLSEIDWKETGILLDNQNQFGELEAGVILNEQSEISRFCYDTTLKWSQIAYLTQKDMELFLKLLNHPNRSKYFTFEILNLMLQYINLKTYFNEKAKIVELDYSEDIQNAKKLVRGEL